MPAVDIRETLLTTTAPASPPEPPLPPRPAATETPLLAVELVPPVTPGVAAVWQSVSHFNPFFYMIDGFRFGFFGKSDVSPWLSLGVVGISLVMVSSVAVHLLRTGYKIRG